MKHLYSSLVSLFFLLSFFLLPVSAKVNYVTVEAMGNGSTEKEAVYDALKDALHQVNGLQMSAKDEASLLSVFEKVNDKETEYTAEKLKQEMKTATKGTIKQYTILSKEKDPNQDNFWIIRIEATIAKYILSQQINRKRLAVIPFRLKKNSDASLQDFSKQFSHSLTAALTQTRRFAMIDREFLEEQDKELDFLKREDVLVEEMARIGNRVGVDFIITGSVDALIQKKNSQTMKTTGKKFYSTRCGAELSYRILDISTSQIVFSGVYNKVETLHGSGCSSTDIAQKAANEISEKITGAIFPIAVVATGGKMLILGQGGEAIRLGQYFTIIQLGQAITDPYTGESLGREEVPVGTVEIVDVQAKQSRAKIVKTTININQDFEPSRYIVRPIPGKSSRARARQSLKKQEKAIEADFSDFEKDSDDDW